MSTNPRNTATPARTLSNAARKTLKQAGLIDPVHKVGTIADTFRVNGVDTPVWRTVVEYVGGRGDLLADALTDGGWKVAGRGRDFIILHTPRETAGEDAFAIAQALRLAEESVIENDPRDTPSQNAVDCAGLLMTPGNAVKLDALRTIVGREAVYRSGVVPAGDVTFPTATGNALAKLGLATKHTLPHKGFRATEDGRKALVLVTLAQATLKWSTRPDGWRMGHGPAGRG